MRLVQLKAGEVRRIAVVEEPKLRLLRDFDSMYALAQAAIANADADRAISRTVQYSTLIAILAGLAAAVFAAWRSRAAREAFKTQVLYENQKRITGRE